jgi:hypothetical protein
MFWGSFVMLLHKHLVEQPRGSIEISLCGQYEIHRIAVFAGGRSHAWPYKHDPCCS